LNNSIQKRLLITTTCVLALFLTITGYVLDRSFTASVVTGAQEQLRLVIYSLMGSVDELDGRLSFNQGISEPRLTQPESGLYAKVSNELGDAIWRSPSAVTSAVDFPVVDAQPGAFVFVDLAGATPRYHLSYTVIWEDVDTEQVVFSVATDQRPFRIAINQFRRSLGIGLGAATALFILAQLLALRWGLLPLRTMAEEVQELEAGKRETLSAKYPKELAGLAQNLDRFVEHEQRSRSRYRNALDDLAHSLKTPLAVVRNSLLEKQVNKPLLTEQLDRMETTVMHQLSKASASGPVVVGQSVDLGQMVERLLRALQTAYLDRGIDVQVKITPQVQARGDERDFMEMVGNLLENAFKYTRSQIVITVAFDPHDPTHGQIVIEDDGEGIPAAMRSEVLRRGRRLDEIQSGQGIGLAMVAELVELYAGQLEIGDGLRGGARVTLTLPG
jgi:two-component system sensor histidine kinase PhoQ